MLQHIIRAVLQDAESINGYGLFSFLVFFVFFTGMLIWAFRLKKNYLNHMGGLPLNGGEKNSQDNPES